MSALGQKQTCRSDLAMSALHPKADIAEDRRHVRFVPKADFEGCNSRVHERSLMPATTRVLTTQKPY
jgi:hypothetical protein